METLSPLTAQDSLSRALPVVHASKETHSAKKAKLKDGSSDKVSVVGLELDVSDLDIAVKCKISFREALREGTAPDIPMIDMARALHDLSEEESKGELDEDDNPTCPTIPVSKQDK